MSATTQANEPQTACLRLSNADACLLSAAIEKLGLCEQISSHPPVAHKGLGNLSALTTEEGNLYSLACHRSVTLDDIRHPSATAVYIRRGHLERVGNHHRSGEVLFMAPGQPLQLCIGGGSEVYFLCPQEPLSEKGLTQYPPGPLIECYLQGARFFPDHTSLVCATAELLLQIGHKASSPGIAGNTPLSWPLDNRVLKAINLMESDSHWAFDLKSLARHVGASERNLYYLMRAETGLTPYRYHQQTRLLRARAMLVDCQRPLPSVSSVAIHQAFYHLGRFAALYRGLFGELPSETLEWLEELIAHSAKRHLAARCCAAKNDSLTR